MSGQARLPAGRARDVGDVIITAELDRRPSRPPDHEAENLALRGLAGTMAGEPGVLLQGVAEAAMVLTRAGSAGISLLEHDGGHDIFRWVAASGAVAPHRGGTLPAGASPCSEALARDEVLLMREPGRAYPACLEIGQDIREALYAPFHADGRPAGVLWAIRHDREAGFEREDARLLENVARFAAAAHGMARALQGSRAADERSRAELAARLADAELLQRLSAGLVREREPDALYRQGLAAAMALMRADAASLQILEPGGERLRLLASRNLHPLSVAHWHLVDAGNASPCSRSLQAHARFVVEDCETDPVFAGTDDLAEFRRSGIRAAQSTPLVARSGRPVGLISTHWRAPRRLVEADLRLLDVLARQLADLIERAATEAALHEGKERQALLLRLSDAIRTVADPADMQRIAMRLLGEHLGLSRAYWFEVVREDGGWVHVIDEAWQREPGGPSMVGRHALKDFGDTMFEGFARGEVIAAADVGALPGVTPGELASYRALGVTAFINVPLLRGGEYSAGIGAHDIRPHAWTQAEIDLIGEVAARTWTALERSRAEAALRESEQNYQTLFAASPVPFVVLASNPPDFTIVAANDAYLATTMTTRDAIVGRRVCDVFTDDPGRPDADGPQVLRDSLHRVLASGLPDALPRKRYDVARPDGRFEERWWLAISAPLFDASGRIRTIIHQVTDVTGLHLAERAEQESQARHAFLLGLSDALRPLADPADIQGEATRLLREHFDAGWCYYMEFNEAGTGGSILRDARRAGLPSLVGFHDLSGFPEFIDHMAAGWLLNVADLANALPWSPRAVEPYTAMGVQSVLAVPLVKQGRPTAALILADTGRQAASERAVALVSEVADRTWAALERARAEGALRASEERLRQFGEASLDILWIRDAATLQWTYLTPAFEAIYGLGRDEALAGDNYRTWQDLIVPEDRARVAASIARVGAGERVTFEYRIRRPADGEVRWLRNTDFPMRDEAGRVTRIGGVGHDVTATKAMQAAIAASETRLRTLTEGIPQLVWRADGEGLWTWCSPQWTAFTGQAQRDSHGSGWLAMVHPDDRAGAMRAWDEAGTHGRLDTEFRVRRASDEAWLWHRTRSVPVRGGDGAQGAILEWLGTTTDIDDLKRLQGEQQVLVAELQHRTRNLLALVRNVARRSIGPSPGRDEYDARLAALGRVQGFLSRSTAYAVPLAELVEAELRAAGEDASGKVRIGGPAVDLPGESVQVLALALHELATNAVKYGALAVPGGRLSVTWRTEAQDTEARHPGVARLVMARLVVEWLVVDWHESGVAMPDGPRARRGYGTELITRALPYQLRARTALEFAHDGVRCRITLPAGAFTRRMDEEETA